MKKHLIILILFITLVGCSNQRKGKTQDMATDTKVSVESVQYKPNEPDIDTDESTLEKQSNKKQPIVKQGNNLELPPGFPNNIISIIENADITNTYDDGESFSVTYQTEKSFDEVVKIHKRLMEGSEVLMEDSQGDSYYTINGTKDNTNVFIVVMKYTPGLTTVTINTNTFDLTAIKEGWEMREEWSDIPNEADFTPIVLIDPTSYKPPPDQLPVENKTIKTLIDDTVINVYVNEKPSDFDKITKDVIFKQKLVSNDDESPYKDGDIIPAILDMIDEKNVETDLVIKGMVEFMEKKYFLAERTSTIKLDSEHAYVPNSEKIKYQVFIPHKGDEYWFVAWSSREMHSINLRKYLIQSEGLDKMVEDSLTGGE